MEKKILNAYLCEIKNHGQATLSASEAEEAQAVTEEEG